MDELSQQFEAGVKGYQAIDSSPLSSSSSEYQALVAEARLAFGEVGMQLSQLSVFSPNEELDDIASDHLRYILTPYYQAELELLVVDRERLDHLNSAKRLFARFLQHCENLKLIHKEDIKSLYTDNPENPTERRATLIARTKREKEMRSKMEELQKQISQSTVAVDEEMHRSNWVNIINHNLVKAISQVESTEREIKMLEFVAQRPPEQIPRDSRGNPLPSSSSNNNNSGSTNKPFAYTILPGGRRQELASQVFRPGYNMATVTPEQAYEAEVKAGRMLKGGANDKKKEESDDEDEDNDEKVWKARAWDDWKDDHPFGSGNSKRT
jgi:immunoglobulin-binding protein 1